MLRRMLALFLAALLALTLCACGAGPAGEAEDAVPAYYTTQYFPLPAETLPRLACIQNGRVYYTAEREGDPFALLYFCGPAGEDAAVLEPFRAFQQEGWKDGFRVYEPWQLMPGPEGTLFLLTRRNAAAADADSFAPWLLQLDGAGNVLQTRELPCPADPAWAEALFTWDDEGNFYLLDNGRILAAGPAGEDRGVLSENARFLFRGKDGRALAVIAPAYGDWRVRSIDPRTLEMKDVCTIPPAAMSARDVTFFPGSGDYDLYAVTDLSLYGYRLDGGTCGQLLTWANCDVEAAALLAMEAEDAGFFCMTYSSAFGGAAVRLEETDTSPDPARTLTLACRGLDRDTALQVLRFNRKNLGWRIRIRDYGTADLAAGPVSMDQFTQDLVSGDLPDLLCTENMDTQVFVDRGLLEDLWPWIDGDAQLGGREALVQPVFDALAREGKLYEITSAFEIVTACGKSALVGDRQGWSAEDAMAVWRAMPEDSSIGGPAETQTTALEQIIALCAQDYMDRETGTARFDSPAFVSLLEFAACYPDSRSGLDAEYDPLALKEGRQMYEFCLINTPADYEGWPLRLFGTEPTALVGFPGVGGNGAYFQVKTPIAMSAASEKKEGAWAFLRMLLTEEGQQDVAKVRYPWERSYGSEMFPTNRAAFSAVMARAVGPGTDSEGKVRPLESYGNGLVLDAWTRAEAEDFWNYICGITVTPRAVGPVAGILRDEADWLFAGEKTAQAAAEAIQRRVQLYLTEQG